MSRSRGGTTTLWAAFVVVAVVSGWIAVQMVGRAVTPASISVLTAGEVSQRLATANSAPTGGKPTDRPKGPKGKATDDPSSAPKPKPTETATPQPTQTQTSQPPATVVRTVASRGGSVVAACAQGSVTLRTWSPAVGFRVDEVRRGPATEAEITFVSSSSEVKLTVRCVAGVPTGQSEVDDESGDSD